MHALKAADFRAMLINPSPHDLGCIRPGIPFCVFKAVSSYAVVDDLADGYH
ncbi:hypothetical protein ALQ27_200096 [Pseudomonas syringae pv. delphinii]|nr:hypothetical protein ALQ27_200096 [Pseudomonas syringae pv. delphinii]